MGISRADSLISSTSNKIPNSDANINNHDDDDQLFFVTSYSDFEKLGKSASACYLLLPPLNQICLKCAPVELSLDLATLICYYCSLL